MATNYKLKKSNYFQKVTTKNQIVIGNSLACGMAHYDLWLKKINGNFKGTYSHTITLDGKIYQHFNPKYFSTPLNIKNYDKNIISIVLENEGSLYKNAKDNKLITWDGTIYNRDSEIVNIKWRNRSKWAPYSEKQMDSLVNLCKKLALDFNIPLDVSVHNTKIDNVGEKKGIYFRSNYSLNYMDVSPAFDFEVFKNKIEN